MFRVAARPYARRDPLKPGSPSASRALQPCINPPE